MNFRIGEGWDVHALVAGRKLILGGVEIPFHLGLLGHSDADVLLHAITDALLGAAALGDIGTHFPDTDARFKGANSLALLAEAARCVREKGFEIGNVDSTVVAQAPKLMPHMAAMRARIAQALTVGVDQVNVKAKTAEKLGPVGQGLAMEARAVVLLTHVPRASGTDEPIESMNFWDQRFSSEGYKYGTVPNAFLMQQAHRFVAGGEVLVPGDGEGRNSVWLAQQGYRVAAMDSSRVGLQKAQALAAERGVQVQTILADLADWVPAPASADALVLTFVHLPPTIRATAHQRLAGALRPGGWLLLEAFHPVQLGHASGGPKAPEMLYTVETLRADFDGRLTEVLAWEGEVMLDEGPGHQGLAHVTRWLGLAPNGPETA